MFHRAALCLLVSLAACARPTVPMRGTDGNVHNVQRATPAEYTEAVERGRKVPIPSRAPSNTTLAASSAWSPAELPWIVDDAPAALALAKAKNLPVFVDVWATWCHSCVHMRAFVLSDAAVRAHAGEAVWLSVDADKPANAPFLAGAELSAYPTFVVLAPGGAERARWAGTMDAEQVVRFLAGGKVVDDALAAVLKMAEADDNAGCVLAGEKLVGSYEKQGRVWDELALQTTVLSCLEPEMTERMKVLKGKRASGTALQWERAARVLKTAVTEPPTSLVAHADDVSSAFEMLVEFPNLEELNHEEMSNRWVQFLDRMSAGVAEPSARAAFDAHRVLAYLAAATPDKAIPMLEQTRRDFPRDFNPAARLAKVYLVMKDYPKARTEAAAALALVAGPRTLRVVTLAADIEKAASNVRAERKQLEQGIARCKKLWLPPSAEKALAELEKRFSKLPDR